MAINDSTNPAEVGSRAKLRADKRKPRDWLDAEHDALGAFYRLKALAALIECASDSQLEFDSADLYGVGYMIRVDTERAKIAFEELLELSLKKKGAEADHA